ncbi:hypothetical protein [Mangrovihabitans endophyticus]|uniref:Uncharacterized protein n=1 Tax=Mangrovihabitans endophyticus TaxID=1751298 RepID=A0A8J3C1T0_9ACTN|nr:hypothetical protein [Mangrovihabitans endophyticus]GGL06791.1 hypothetical protein GCM10012284_46220 [Mangrovihabitans endophyticus]
MSGRDEPGGLEELFAFEPEPPAAEEAPEPAPKRRSPALWVLRNVALIAIATVVTVAGLHASGIKVPLLLIVSAFVALRLLMFAVSEVAPPPTPKRRSDRRGEESGDYRWDGADSLRAAVRRWERSLEWAQSDPKRFSRNVLPVLAELADERLRLRHGITRSTDPRRARELLGDPLWRTLGDPSGKPPKPRDLAGYVETMEQL